MKFIVYKTTNKINGRYYIGKHQQKTDEFDGYLGSGPLIKKAIKTYGRENFVRETLAVFDNEDECYLAEKQFVGDSWKHRGLSYNLSPGGHCGMGDAKQHWWDFNQHKKLERKQAWLENNPSKTKEGRARVSKANANRVWTEASRKIVSEQQKGVPKPKTECKYCNRMIANNMLHRYHMENCKEKTS